MRFPIKKLTRWVSATGLLTTSLRAYHSLLGESPLPPADEETTKIINHHAKKIGIKSPVKVYMTRRGTSACGEVTLSSGRINLNAKDTGNEFAVLHELGHLKNHDVVKLCVLDLAAWGLMLLSKNPKPQVIMPFYSACLFLIGRNAEKCADREAMQYCGYKGLAQGISFFERDRFNSQNQRAFALKKASGMEKQWIRLRTTADGEPRFILWPPFFDTHPSRSARIGAIKQSLVAGQHTAPAVKVLWQESANAPAVEVNIDGNQLRSIISKSNRQDHNIALNKILLKPYRENSNVELYDFGKKEPHYHHNISNIRHLKDNPNELISALGLFFNEPDRIGARVDIDAKTAQNRRIEKEMLIMIAEALDRDVDTLRVVWPENDSPSAPYCYVYSDGIKKSMQPVVRPGR